jgi:hypothetical protein
MCTVTLRSSDQAARRQLKTLGTELLGAMHRRGTSLPQGHMADDNISINGLARGLMALR